MKKTGTVLHLNSSEASGDLVDVLVVVEKAETLLLDCVIFVQIVFS